MGGKKKTSFLSRRSGIRPLYTLQTIVVRPNDFSKWQRPLDTLEATVRGLNDPIEMARHYLTLRKPLFVVLIVNDDGSSRPER